MSLASVIFSSSDCFPDSSPGFWASIVRSWQMRCRRSTIPVRMTGHRFTTVSYLHRFGSQTAYQKVWSHVYSRESRWQKDPLNHRWIRKISMIELTLSYPGDHREGKELEMTCQRILRCFAKSTRGSLVKKERFRFWAPCHERKKLSSRDPSRSYSHPGHG